MLLRALHLLLCACNKQALENQERPVARLNNCGSTSVQGSNQGSVNSTGPAGILMLWLMRFNIVGIRASAPTTCHVRLQSRALLLPSPSFRWSTPRTKPVLVPPKASLALNVLQPSLHVQACRKTGLRKGSRGRLPSVQAALGQQGALPAATAAWGCLAEGRRRGARLSDGRLHARRRARRPARGTRRRPRPSRGLRR